MKKQPKPHKPTTFTRSNPSEEKPQSWADMDAKQTNRCVLSKMLLSERENSDELTRIEAAFVVGIIVSSIGLVLLFVLSYR